MAIAADRISILLPLGVAVTMTFSTIVIQALFLLPIIHFVRFEFRIGRAGVYFWRNIAIITGATLLSLAAHVLAIAMWGLVFTFCGEFYQLPRAVYHSAMNYTTLGDSEKVMSGSWKILGPLEAANGMLMFGVSTTLLFAIVQRLIQTRLDESSSNAVDEGRRAS
jgi:hypothetical protein